jgi:hypothetical protein
MRPNPQERLIEWSEKIKDQKLSKKSILVWCRENGVSYNTFHYWQKRLKSANQTISLKTSFVEIPEDVPLEISLPGVKLYFANHFDKQALIKLLKLLGS